MIIWPDISEVIFLSDIHCSKFGDFQAKGSKDIEQTTFYQRPSVKPWPLTSDFKINRGHLLPSGIHCTKFCNFHQRDQKILSWKTSSLTLTFDHVTSKLRLIYSIGAPTVPSLATFTDIEWISFGSQTDRSTDGRPTDRPTGAKQYAPFLKGGNNKKKILTKLKNHWVNINQTLYSIRNIIFLRLLILS